MFTTDQDKKLLRHIQELTEKRSDIFWLWIGGKTIKEIAQGLNLNPSNVATICIK